MLPRSDPCRTLTISLSQCNGNELKLTENKTSKSIAKIRPSTLISYLGPLRLNMSITFP